MLVGKGKGENENLKEFVWTTIFLKKIQKISGSQEDNQISIFGCPHSIFGRRGHEDMQILLPCYLFSKQYAHFPNSIHDIRNVGP